jgi:hypothetical protein
VCYDQTNPFFKPIVVHRAAKAVAKLFDNCTGSLDTSYCWKMAASVVLQNVFTDASNRFSEVY